MYINPIESAIASFQRGELDGWELDLVRRRIVALSERGTRDKKHAALYRRIRLKAWLDSCVDDLVVNTKQAKESEFNDGYDLMIETEYPFNEPAERSER